MNASKAKSKKQRRDDSEDTVATAAKPPRPTAPKPSKTKGQKVVPEVEARRQMGEEEHASDMGIAGILTLYGADEDEEDLVFYDYVNRLGDAELMPSYMVPSQQMEEMYPDPVTNLKEILAKRKEKGKEKKAAGTRQGEEAGIENGVKNPDVDMGSDNENAETSFEEESGLVHRTA
ncbi:uncharacterized protein LOC129595878 [Paramacrobiotus metropolitanus]|uniref:uncharacterized protein LOC129595878 n=1 Tax=Paramacrobiotus metropolitanus TaxID=2943436 RepID=UPI002446562D|nr:uncharacterized protein LOC129595878 [Paramacrobiotus metropolitanus]XP_055348984.1 uncharacterized protein LOC129595878 [Paramacrobiotus metropolitanus]